MLRDDQKLVLESCVTEAFKEDTLFAVEPTRGSCGPRIHRIWKHMATKDMRLAAMSPRGSLGIGLIGIHYGSTGSLI